MDDKEFLAWILGRLEGVHGENPKSDYMVRLRQIASDGTYHDHERFSCPDCRHIDESAYDSGRDSPY